MFPYSEVFGIWLETKSKFDEDERRRVCPVHRCRHDLSGRVWHY